MRAYLILRFIDRYYARGVRLDQLRNSLPAAKWVIVAHRLPPLRVIRNPLDLNLLLEPFFIFYNILVDSVIVEHRQILGILPLSWLSVHIGQLLDKILRINILFGAHLIDTAQGITTLLIIFQ